MGEIKEGFKGRVSSHFGRKKITDQDLKDFYNIALFLVLFSVVLNLVVGILFERNNFALASVSIADVILMFILVVLKGILIRINVMMDKIR
jgi:hypothetical protein